MSSPYLTKKLFPKLALLQLFLSGRAWCPAPTPRILPRFLLL